MLMKKSTLTALLLWLNGTLFSQIFYLESFPDSVFPAGWQTNSSRIFMHDRLNSSGYTQPPASGNYNVRMNDCQPVDQTVRLVISGVISTVGRTDIRVGFGRRRSTAHSTPILFEWSSDSITWHTISTDVASGATNTWSVLYFDLPPAAENVPNLRFRFSYTTQENVDCEGPPNLCIDDFAVGEKFSLPMELMYFDAWPEVGSNRLRWATASEENSAWFEVERSVSDFRFETIGRVAAAGSSRAERWYEFSDDEPLDGVCYYRLRMVDTDGTFSFSPVRQVHNSSLKGGLRVFPSPAREVLQVETSAPAGQEARWQIWDFLGRLWLQGYASGDDLWEISLHTLPAGSYVLQYSWGAVTLARQFLKH